jgi:hypothetical protein
VQRFARPHVLEAGFVHEDGVGDLKVAEPSDEHVNRRAGEAEALPGLREFLFGFQPEVDPIPIRLSGSLPLLVRMQSNRLHGNGLAVRRRLGGWRDDGWRLDGWRDNGWRDDGWLRPARRTGRGPAC